MKHTKYPYEAPRLMAFLLATEDILTESDEGDDNPFEGDLDPALD